MTARLFIALCLLPTAAACKDTAPPAFAGPDRAVLAAAGTRLVVTWPSGRDTETADDKIRYRVIVRQQAFEDGVVFEDTVTGTGLEMPRPPQLPFEPLRVEVTAIDEAGNRSTAGHRPLDPGPRIRTLAGPGARLIGATPSAAIVATNDGLRIVSAGKERDIALPDGAAATAACLGPDGLIITDGRAVWRHQQDAWIQLPPIPETAAPIAQLACGTRLHAREAGEPAGALWYLRDGDWIDTDIKDGTPIRQRADDLVATAAGDILARHGNVHQLDGQLSTRTLDVAAPHQAWLAVTGTHAYAVEAAACPRSITRVNLATWQTTDLPPADRPPAICNQAHFRAGAVTPDGTLFTADQQGLIVRADDRYYRVANRHIRALAAIRDNAVIAETPDGVVELAWPAP